MDDFKVGDTVIIDGYGEVSLTSAGWYDDIIKYSSGTYFTIDRDWAKVEYYYSGAYATYFRLQFDILNTQMKAHNFYKDFIDCLCTYNDKYTFGCWLRQHRVLRNSGYNLVTVDINAEGWNTDMLYRDQFSLVFTLPNDVVTRVKNGDPMEINFKLGENEFTYIYRK